MPEPIPVIVNCYNVKEATELCSRTGVTKANMRIDKVLMSSFMGGAILALACAATLSTQVAPWYQENAPGLIRMIGAIVFPWGLTTIIVSGADLCTGSFLFTTVSVLHRRLSIPKMLLHWTLTFWGNLAGSLFVSCLIIGYGGVFSTEPFTSLVFSFNEKKVVTPGWEMVFLRGIGANWLVCLACFLALMAREYFSKVAAVWWPTFTFVCLGFDHVVANMFFVPLSIFLGDPQINVGFYIWKSMIPALIGNIVGGVVFVASVYWYMNLTGNPGPVSVDGQLFPADQQPLIGVGDSGASSPNRRPSNEEKKSPEAMV